MAKHPSSHKSSGGSGGSGNRASRMYSPPDPGATGTGGGATAAKAYVSAQPVPVDTNPPHKSGSHGGFTSKPK